MKQPSNKLSPASSKPLHSRSRINLLEIIGTATRGGMENYIANFLQQLPPDTFNITCICPCESGFTKLLRQLGVEQVYITPLADNPEWRSVQTVLEVCRLHQIDLLHAHMPKSHVLAGIAGSLLQKPVVATVHGMHITAHELGVALACRSHLITNCQETYFQALAMGVPASRVNLFQNGVDVQTYHPGLPSGRLRTALGLSPGQQLVGFVGRLEHEKGPDLFVRAAAHLHHIMPHLVFVMAGDGSMLEALQQLAHQLRLDDHLHFVNWCTSTAEIYPDLDLLAHSSRSDGTSLVVLEAMACGKPVMGMAVGGVREMIANEQTGMQVPAGDWESMALQMALLLKQPAVLQAMGKAARERIETHFDSTINTSKTVNLLRQVAINWQQQEVAPHFDNSNAQEMALAK